MAEVEEYRRWLVGGVATREVVETLDISHSAFNGIRIVNSDRQIIATLENGKERTFQAGRFFFTPAEVSNGTAQGTSVAVGAGDGSLYDTIKAMTFEEREEPIKLVYRTFFFDDPSEPLVSPPPVWYVHGIEATHELVQADLQATHLRVQRIGLYYTAQEYPAIKYT